MVEVKRHDFAGLPKVMQELSRWGKKFIVVLDDLSFEEFEVEYKALKSILDGGLEVNLIMCCSMLLPIAVILSRKCGRIRI